MRPLPQTVGRARQHFGRVIIFDGSTLDGLLPKLDILETAPMGVLAARMGVLSADRVKPIRLSEEAGVRLALALVATAPVAKPMRVDAILRAVERLTVEETYYWYAKVHGDDGGRLRRALRLFLAEE